MRAGAGSTAESRKQEAFESGNPRDAYSSVSHLKGNLDSLSFAIGLREEGGQEGALERLLPMLKIQPRPAGDVRAYVAVDLCMGFVRLKPVPQRCTTIQTTVFGENAGWGLGCVIGSTLSALLPLMLRATPRSRRG